MVNINSVRMPTNSKATMLYQPVVRSGGLPNRVKKQLFEMISSGRLGPGDRLPAERELARQLGVSRNVVREALRSLVDMNILEARQGAGVFVASLDIESLIEPLQFVVSLERTTLRKLVEARLVIEPGIAELAAQRGSDADRAALHALLDESIRSSRAPQHFLEIDVKLHGRIVQMAGNPFLARIMDSLGSLARSSREFTNAVPAMREAAQVDHERIVAAVQARDGAAARAIMHEHLEHVAATLDRDR